MYARPSAKASLSDALALPEVPTADLEQVLHECVEMLLSEIRTAPKRLRHGDMQSIGEVLAQCGELHLADDIASMLQAEAVATTETVFKAYRAYFAIQGHIVARQILDLDSEGGMRTLEALEVELAEANETIINVRAERLDIKPPKLLVLEEHLLSPVLELLAAGGEIDTGLRIASDILERIEEPNYPNKQSAALVALEYLAKIGEIKILGDNIHRAPDSEQLQLLLACSLHRFILSGGSTSYDAREMVREAAAKIKSKELLDQSVPMLINAWVVLELYQEDLTFQNNLIDQIGDFTAFAEVLMKAARHLYESGIDDRAQACLRRAAGYNYTVKSDNLEFDALLLARRDPSAIFEFIDRVEVRKAERAMLQLRALCQALDGRDREEALGLLTAHPELFDSIEKLIAENCAAQGLQDKAFITFTQRDYCKVLHAFGKSERALSFLDEQFRVLERLSSVITQPGDITGPCLNLIKSAVRCREFSYVAAAVRQEMIAEAAQVRPPSKKLPDRACLLKLIRKIERGVGRAPIMSKVSPDPTSNLILNGINRVADDDKGGRLRFLSAAARIVAGELMRERGIEYRAL